MKKGDLVYRFKIQLLGCPYSCWRRVFVSGKTSMHDFAGIIMAAMGWEMAHLWEFDDKFGKHYGLPDADDTVYVHNAKRIKVSAVFNAMKSIHFTYDFGDDWRHKVTLEEITEGTKYDLPACTAGKGACPPEDCGGIWGLEHMLEVLSDPQHEEYETIKDWAGNFNPLDFNASEWQDSFKNGLDLFKDPLW